MHTEYTFFFKIKESIHAGKMQSNNWMVGTFICFPLKAYLPFTEQTDYCKHLLYDIELCTVRTKSGLSGGDDSLDFDES